MKNYIDIGLVARESDIEGAAIGFIEQLEDYSLINVHFPNEGNYNEWVTLGSKDCSVEKAVGLCAAYDPAFATGMFRVKGRAFSNVRFSFERCAAHKKCFLIQIPSDDLLSLGIDEAEAVALELLNHARGFLSGFCDFEAHAEDDRYAISIRYCEKPTIAYASWKIDGLTER